MRLSASIVVCLSFLLQLVTPPAHGAELLVPPVDGLVTRGFEAPASTYGPGHRGVDFDVPRGTAVRAAAAGTVTFAGRVATMQAVTIAHGEALVTTYSNLGEVLVEKGDVVAQGTWVGRSSASHGDIEGVHFGVLERDEYVDPTSFFGPVDAAGAVHLVQLGQASGDSDSDPECTAPVDLKTIPGPPNRNIAVAIAGIGSKTEGGVSAEMYEQGVHFLGYPDRRIFNFSYRGPIGPGLHEAYKTVDTFEDLRVAAERLRDLLIQIRHRYPGVPVDLIAHSQGGIVARTLLELGADAWSGDLPRIEHLVTFATPHRGAPAAGAVRDLREGTTTGSTLLSAASRWARSGAPVPDPDSVAASQLAPGSPLMDQLARRDVLWGTQVLAIGTPADVVVPADRAAWPEKLSRTIAPEDDLWAHGAIVASPAARGLAYDFLRNASDPCSTAWDTWGRRAGSVIGLGERLMPTLYGGAEIVTGIPLTRYAVAGARVALEGPRLAFQGLRRGLSLVGSHLHR
jgi:hypothetical protein